MYYKENNQLRYVCGRIRNEIKHLLLNTWQANLIVFEDAVSMNAVD
jgi:hypothetical protein